MYSQQVKEEEKHRALPGNHLSFLQNQDIWDQAEYTNLMIMHTLGASLVAQMVKKLPAMQETQVQTLGGEDPLEKEMATYSNILPWRIPWTEEPVGLQSIALQRVG